VSAFAERAQLLHRKNGAKHATFATAVGVVADPREKGGRYRSADAIDQFLDGVDILDAYRRWCGKSEPDPGGRREGIMISCPNPAHPDHDPSAWINLDQQVYFCACCGDGGDKFTIASYHFGLDTKTRFPELKRQMAKACGYAVVPDLAAIATSFGESGSSDLEPVNWQEAWLRRDLVNEWLLEPVIPARAQVLLYAPRKTGKSLLVLEWAAGIASGRSVLGRPASDPADVLVIDFENTLADDVIPRLEDFGYAPDELDRLHYYSFPAIRPLDTAEGGQRLEELIIKHRPVLVVLDSFARIVAGKENESDTLRDYYRHTAVVLKNHGVASIRLDNTGKDTTAGARGSSAKDDDVDLIWQLKPRDGGLRLHRDAQRRTSAPEHVDLRRIQEPCLQHVLIAASSPAGTKELAGTLDRLDIPADASNRAARQVLNDAGEKASNELLAAALRYRKNVWSDFGTVTGTPPSSPPGTPPGTEDSTRSHQGGTRNGTLRNAPVGNNGTRGVSIDTPVPVPREMAAKMDATVEPDTSSSSTATPTSDASVAA
jgi:AAA domain